MASRSCNRGLREDSWFHFKKVERKLNRGAARGATPRFTGRPSRTRTWDPRIKRRSSIRSRAIPCYHKSATSEGCAGRSKRHLIAASRDSEVARVGHSLSPAAGFRAMSTAPAAGAGIQRRSRTGLRVPTGGPGVLSRRSDSPRGGPGDRRRRGWPASPWRSRSCGTRGRSSR